MRGFKIWSWSVGEASDSDSRGGSLIDSTETKPTGKGQQILWGGGDLVPELRTNLAHKKSG